MCEAMLSRPKGSTVKARDERTSKMKAILVEAATLISNTCQGEADGKLVRHNYKQILTSLEVKRGLRRILLMGIVRQLAPMSEQKFLAG
jgi:hypothetical protein